MKSSAAITAFFLVLSPALAQAPDRTVPLLNSFRTLCIRGVPAFDDINRTATALQLPVQEDIGNSLRSGPFTRSKSWLVPPPGGPHELIATEANGPLGHISACGISAPELGGESFKQALISQLRLGKPSSEATSASGDVRTTVWLNGNGTALRLIDTTPKAGHAPMLFYEVIGPPRP